MINTTYYTRLKALYNGWRDGRRNYTSPDADTPSQYVREMKNACEHQLAHLAEKWKEQDKKLFAEYRTCKEHLDISERSLDETQRDNNEAREKLDLATRALDNLEHVSPGKRWYIVFFIFITLVEFPINSIIFDIFGEARWLTMLMAASICFTLPWAAHIAGKALKEGLVRNRVVTAKFSIMLVLVVALLGAFAYMRERFLTGMEAQKFLGASVDQNMMTILFFLINGFVFLIALWTSYSAHPKDPVTFERILKSYDLAKQLEKETYERTRKAETACKKASQDLNDAISKRKNSFEKTQNEADAISQGWNSLIHHYYKVNVRHRRDGKEPPSFHGDTTYRIPKDIEALDWDFLQNRNGSTRSHDRDMDDIPFASVKGGLAND